MKELLETADEHKEGEACGSCFQVNLITIRPSRGPRSKPDDPDTDAAQFIKDIKETLPLKYIVFNDARIKVTNTNRGFHARFLFTPAPSGHGYTSAPSHPPCIRPRTIY